MTRGFTIACLLGSTALSGCVDRTVAPTGLPSSTPSAATDASTAPVPLDPSVVADATSDAPRPPSDGARDLVNPIVPPSGMILVEGGTFTMGTNSGGEGDEHPAHDVTIATFFLDRTEVTQAAYDACVAKAACAPPDPSTGPTFRGANKPVVGVSWFDAERFCTWRNARLPREAEFERAVRGSDGRRFPWGNDSPSRDHTVFARGGPEDVGTHPLGRGPYGHDDLAGNVWEWMSDDYDPLAYTRSGAASGTAGSCSEIEDAQRKLRKDGKQGFTGTNPIPTECEKAIRGGAYNYPADGLRSTNRVHHPARFRLKMTGFRCAADAPPSK